MGRTTEDISNFVFRFEHFKNDTYEFTPDEMFKFAQLVAAAEREECAKEISAEINDEIEDEAYCILVALLARIRARGQE
jgi:nitrogen regulatory protein PII-like uncharacterized protein